MKIVSWNCAGKFREDYETIFKQNADIYVIQECENPKDGREKYKEYKESVENFAGNNIFWKGDLHYKGLGVFVNKEITDVKEIPVEGKCKHFIALNIENSFNLLAVWAMGKDKKEGLPPYVEMIHDFLDENNKNDNLFNVDKNKDQKIIIMCGDFNSSAVFNPRHTYKRTHRDINGNPKNHDYLDEKLNDMNLYSVYHEITREKSGEEDQVTFFEAKDEEKSFHLDYVYTNKQITDKTTLIKKGEKLNKDSPNEFEILDDKDWLNLSDHLPLVFDIDEKFLKEIENE